MGLPSRLTRSEEVALPRPVAHSNVDVWSGRRELRTAHTVVNWGTALLAGSAS